MPSVLCTSYRVKQSAFLILLAVSLWLLLPSECFSRQQKKNHPPSPEQYSIANDKVKLTVTVSAGGLRSEVFEALPAWMSGHHGGKKPLIESDGDFALDVMYTDWQAPGKLQNAENPVLLTKKNFRLTGHDVRPGGKGGKELTIDFKGTDNPLDLRITWQLDSAAFYARKSIAVRDTVFGHHFLRWMWIMRGDITGMTSVVKAGGFGQPVVGLSGGGGAFFGVEFPDAENHLTKITGAPWHLECGHEYGERIGAEWLVSEWTVEGCAPGPEVRQWFFRYVDDLRVAPLRPYTLYNSWYDLRSPRYPKTPPEHFMTEQNVLRMVDLLRTNMIEKHHITLDAFVLDDGWDVYESDWQLSAEQFPNGLKPVADELKKTNTTLGVWFGPIGGYSFRSKRIGWMKNNGYEVVGDQLCAAGKKYSELFRKRTTDFVTGANVGYYKWDGIQFSCSEPDHGHPVDIYSRRAVMKSVIDWCAAVREKNPSMFLNITSGTWLSPWWLKYANTIWMQGEDYGYSDVPSISQRDAAITYRDFVLYDDFRNLDCWYPVSGLMTHGIIKGKLELLGSPEEPLDKFTDDVLLYVARGVSMYELYVSPDILTEGEWSSISSALSWARDRFPVLRHTEMIGGNPMKREPYGYAHASGDRGIFAVRNPFIEPKSLTLMIDQVSGFDRSAGSLVFEKVYPTRWISPKLYKTGDRIEVPLDGYETAVYELYPLSDAAEPLVAGVLFDVVGTGPSAWTLKVYGVSGVPAVLNPRTLGKISADGRPIEPAELPSFIPKAGPILTDSRLSHEPDQNAGAVIRFDCSETARDPELALLLVPDSSETAGSRPVVTVMLDQKEITVRSEEQQGKSRWYTAHIVPGRHEAVVRVLPGKTEKSWSGTMTAWVAARQIQPAGTIELELRNTPAARPMPPYPRDPAEVRRNIRIGQLRLSTEINP